MVQLNILFLQHMFLICQGEVIKQIKLSGTCLVFSKCIFFQRSCVLMVDMVCCAFQIILIFLLPFLKGIQYKVPDKKSNPLPWFCFSFFLSQHSHIFCLIFYHFPDNLNKQIKLTYGGQYF